MDIMNLMSARLKLIAEMCDCDIKVADIGTDHAYVPICLVLQGKATFAVASDINEGPVLRAKENVEKFGLSDKISVRIGAGVETLETGEVDTVVIAGMGGLLITNILADGIKNGILTGKETFILQPMTDDDELRRYVCQMGYYIEKESICREENKLYTVMKIKPGKYQPEDDFEFYLSKPMTNSPLVGDFVSHRLRVLNKIKDGMMKSSDPKDMGRIDWLIGKYSEFEEMR